MTSALSVPGADVRAVVAGLMAVPGISGEPDPIPRRPGMYAWWARTDVFPDLPGPANPEADGVRLLRVGGSSDLRRRITKHLTDGDTSTFRSTLAALLVDDEGWTTTWTGRVALADADEPRLSAWMHEHLALTWTEHPDPKAVEAEVLAMLEPPLNGSGEILTAARRAYTARR